MEQAIKHITDLSVTKALKQHWRQPSFSYLSRPRPDHGLMLLTSGRIDFITASDTLHARAGDVVYLPHGCRYEARFLLPLGPIDNYLINFLSASLQTGADSPLLLLQNAPPGCTGLFREIVHAYRAQQLSALREQGLMLLLLDEILHARLSPQTALTEQACTLLQQSDLSVRDVARRCSLSESSLRALFQSQLHISPVQFRLKSRLDRAAYLLESTDKSVGEIAEETHFYDAAAFCRLFKRQFNQTPRQYARSKKL